MSVLRKLPFINHLVSSLSTEELTTLKAKFNIPSIERKITFVQDVNGFEFLQASDAGLICTCTMKLSREKVVSGILVFHSVDLCVLIGYTDGVAGSDILPVYLLNFSNRKYTGFGELLTADELRNVVDDALQGEGGSSDIEFNVDIPEGVAPEKATNVKAGEDYFEFSDEGIPAPGGAKQVLVSNDDLEPEWTDAVPLAENLKTTAGVTNDTVYSAGPTGGLADISNDNVGYLQEIKGYTIVWNQLLDAEHTEVTLQDGRHYAIFDSGGNERIVLGDGETVITYVNEFSRLYDLSLMFNDNFPFNVNDNETEYPANGNLPAQVVTPIQKFMRLFADIDLYHEPYNAGEFKSVSCNKITEVGRNLWNGDEENGILLLPGYRYEIYLEDQINSKYINIKLRGTNTWGQTTLTRATRTDGKYIWYYAPSVPTYVKSATGENIGSIVYVGFVHSGNNCLTCTYAGVAVTNVEIPEYTKKEYSISGISGLRSVYYSEINACDTVDFTRVGEVDLDEIADQITFDEDRECWLIPVSAMPHLSSFTSTVLGNDPHWLIEDGFKRDEETDEILGIYVFLGDYSSEKPSGKMLYAMEPQPTGLPAFAPITLDPVDDMGFEYFSGMDYAPVNQKTFYGVNLKDKLVNLQEGTKVEAISYNSAYGALYGLTIGNTSYKLLPYYISTANEAIYIGKTAPSLGLHSTGLGMNCVVSATNATSIGYTANAGAQSVAIGSQANASFNYGVAVGAEAKVGSVTHGVAIGDHTSCYIPSTVSFDGSGTSYYVRTITLFDASKIFFKNEAQMTSYTTFEAYTQGHFLSEYITNNELVLGDGKYWISYTDASTHKGFAGSEIKGVHITLVVNGSTSHSVVGMDLLPYDTTNAYGFNSYARVDVDGTVDDIVATINADGAVVITAPAGSTIASAKYYLR